MVANISTNNSYVKENVYDLQSQDWRKPSLKEHYIIMNTIKHSINANISSKSINIRNLIQYIKLQYLCERYIVNSAYKVMKCRVCIDTSNNIADDLYIKDIFKNTYKCIINRHCDITNGLSENALIIKFGKDSYYSIIHKSDIEETFKQNKKALSTISGESLNII